MSEYQFPPDADPAAVDEIMRNIYAAPQQEGPPFVHRISGEFQKCRKPDCMRKVKISVAYCCASCAQADKDGFELESYSPALHWPLCHSAGCEQRSAERGECDPLEAITLEQR